MSDTYAAMLEDHRTQRRAVLLARAAEAIDAHGLRSVTIDQMAERAGIAKVVLYRYFGSKDALIDAVLDDMVEALLTVDSMPAEVWTERLPHTLALARTKRAALRILLRQAPYDPRFGRHLERLRSVLADRTTERIDAALGAPGAMPGDPRLLARMVSDFLLDAYLGWLDAGDPNREPAFLDWLATSIRAMTRAWWEGQRAESPQPCREGRDH